MDKGTFTIQTRIYLTAEQRTKLEALLRIQARDLDEVASEALIAYLDAHNLPASDDPNDPYVPLRDELRRRRGELRRLGPALADRNNPAPDWLTAMAADLEREIARLQEALGGEGTP